MLRENYYPLVIFLALHFLALLRNEDLIKAAFADWWVLASTALSHRKLPLPNPERSRRVAG